MTFKFEGKLYRIVFFHDPDRSLGAHRMHQLSAIHHTGVVRVACLTCGSLLLAPLPKDLRARNTHCLIQVKERSNWRTVAEGHTKLNVKAGDRFCKDTGREIALEAALGVTEEQALIAVLKYFCGGWETFAAKALMAYDRR